MPRTTTDRLLDGELRKNDIRVEQVPIINALEDQQAAINPLKELIRSFFRGWPLLRGVNERKDDQIQDEIELLDYTSTGSRSSVTSPQELIFETDKSAGDACLDTSSQRSSVTIPDSIYGCEDGENGYPVNLSGTSPTPTLNTKSKFESNNRRRKINAKEPISNLISDDLPMSTSSSIITTCSEFITPTSPFLHPVICRSSSSPGTTEDVQREIEDVYLDTGSSFDLIQSDFADKQGLERMPVPKPITTNTIIGEAPDLLKEYVLVPIEKGNEEIKEKFYVVHGKQEWNLLYGVQTIKQKCLLGQCRAGRIRESINILTRPKHQYKRDKAAKDRDKKHKDEIAEQSKHNMKDWNEQLDSNLNYHNTTYGNHHNNDGSAQHYGSQSRGSS
ncbi:hypothetical protein B0O99DRAFT_599933 [Bisporella sp. PMI_857]|nr:hypothetical protein B0O99DRAFT_599933 [Bisporella sp. PMI_857]